ncbi:MAG TPA: response regulator transcription factor [Polyangiaceae bacterium]
MRVLVADDHAMMRDGLRAVLEKAGVEVVGEAANGHEAITEATRLRPDVVIMDIAMPELNGVEATRRLTREIPGLKVLGLSMNADQRYVNAMLEAGAAGHLLKNAAAAELLGALDLVTRGEIYVGPAVGTPGVRARRGTPVPGSIRALSPRELEVLKLVAEGKSSKEIGVALNIGLPTVETHRRQIMDKLDLRTIAELTKYAVGVGLTAPEP